MLDKPVVTQWRSFVPDKFKSFTIKLPKPVLNEMDVLVKWKLYGTKSEIIRFAVRDFIKQNSIEKFDIITLDEQKKSGSFSVNLLAFDFKMLKRLGKEYANLLGDKCIGKICRVAVKLLLVNDLRFFTETEFVKRIKTASLKLGESDLEKIRTLVKAKMYVCRGEFIRYAIRHCFFTDWKKRIKERMEWKKCPMIQFSVNMPQFFYKSLFETGNASQFCRVIISDFVAEEFKLLSKREGRD